VLNTSSEVALRLKLHSTRGGVRDTELNELAVRPTSSPVAVRAVTMVTPVANMPSAVRKSALLKLGAAALRTGCGDGGGRWGIVGRRWVVT
jgi:hypothetical protein